MLSTGGKVKSLKVANGNATDEILNDYIIRMNHLEALHIYKMFKVTGQFLFSHSWAGNSC